MSKFLNVPKGFNAIFLLHQAGEDLLQFDFGNSSGATNCQLEEANKFGRGQRKEVELP